MVLKAGGNRSNVSLRGHWLVLTKTDLNGSEIETGMPSDFSEKAVKNVQCLITAKSQ